MLNGRPATTQKRMIEGGFHHNSIEIYKGLFVALHLFESISDT